MTFFRIEFGSSEYRQECELRNAVLRLPIGMSLYDEDLSGERGQMHFGLFDGPDLIACTIALVLSPSQVKIRQMAVAQAYQGHGHGRRLLEGVEAQLAAIGITDVVLHARRTATGFYAKVGYTQTGNEFTEVGLPHIKMVKRLT